MAPAGPALYRTILRLHRTKLPFHLRRLGDAYVREEFRKHAKTDAKWLGAFFTEWRAYAGTLERADPAAPAGAAGAVGADLAPDALRALTDEQRQMLDKLKAEADEAWRTPAAGGAA